MYRTRRVCLILLAAASATALWADVDGADPRLTGAPGDSDCTSCHTGTAVNAGGGSIKIVLPGAATYTPGVKQHISVQIADSLQKRWGFELTARVDSNPTSAQAGSLAATDTYTQVKCDNGRKAPCATTNIIQFITHTLTGTRNGTTGSISFEFDWTPPDTDVGSVTLYASGNAANGNGLNSGDHIYTTSVQLTTAVSVPKPTINSTNGVVTAASPAVDGTAPASWLAINGTNLANSTLTWTMDEAAAGLPTTLDGVSVQVNNLPAYVQFVSPTKLIVLTPTDPSVGQVNVQVTNNGVTGDAIVATMAAIAPALFTADNKYLVTTHGDTSLADRLDVFPSVDTWPAPTPAQPGEVISFYGTGFGPVDPAVTDGQLQQNAANITTPFTLTIGGEQVDAIFAGLAPGFAGIYQIKTTIPADLPDGDQPVVIQMNSLNTQQSDNCCYVQVKAAVADPTSLALRLPK